jgi:uncharacterized coiled-coil DUF342 family protein
MKMQGKSPIMKKMLGDLNKDGKMSSYETARQNAIEKSMAEPSTTVAKKTTGPGGSKKTQRIRARVEKNEDKLFTEPLGTKKEERLYKKDARLQKKLRKSKEKDKAKSVAKNYKKGYYGV